MLLSTLKVSGFSFEIFVTETKCMGADQIIKQELHLNTFYQLPIINFLLIISSHTLGYLQIRVSSYHAKRDLNYCVFTAKCSLIFSYFDSHITICSMGRFI